MRSPSSEAPSDLSAITHRAGTGALHVPAFLPIPPAPVLNSALTERNHTPLVCTTLTRLHQPCPHRGSRCSAFTHRAEECTRRSPERTLEVSETVGYPDVRGYAARVRFGSQHRPGGVSRLRGQRFGQRPVGRPDGAGRRARQGPDSALLGGGQQVWRSLGAPTACSVDAPRRPAPVVTQTPWPWSLCF